MQILTLSGSFVIRGISTNSLLFLDIAATIKEISYKYPFCEQT